ncbi:PAS fold family [Verrucomicrobiia bacterium DG1235]|nr:PAS fold family [Verrucomicrobiae bacterium DG1235]
MMIRAFLRDEGYDLLMAEDATEALGIIQSESVDVVVTDVVMPGLSGIDLLERILRVSPRTEVILVSGEPTLDTAMAAVRAGANDYIVKPVTKEKITRVVGRAAKLKLNSDDLMRLREENLIYQEKLERLVEERTQSLLESETKYRDVFEGALFMIHILDTEGNILNVNPAMCNTLEFEKGELLGISLLEIVSEEDREIAEVNFERARLGESVKEYEVKLISKSGKLVHVRAAANPIVQDGKVVSIQGNLIDETKRKTAEAELADERVLMRTLMDNIPDSIYFKDLESRFLQVSRFQSNLFGYERPEELCGLSDFDIFQGDMARKKFEDEQSIIRTGTPIIDKEEKEKFLNGEAQYVSTTKMPLRSVSGEVIGTFGVSRDITNRKRLEQNLSFALERALEASRLKSEFIATMSHELRTPMNGILGMADILLLTELSESQKDSAKLIKKCGQNLMSIISDILDFSKIETRNFQLEVEPLEIQLIVNETLAFFRPKAESKGISLRCEIDEHCSDIFYGDSKRIRQVLTNLVGNAIKFTEEGYVRVRADFLGEGRMRIEVEDTGVGIDEVFQSKVFQAFTQEDGSDSRRYGGTGLGLAITKQLVELMGGLIDFDSQVGVGSRFWFEIDSQPRGVFERGQKTVEGVGAGVRFEGSRVLVVDDDELSQRVAAVALDAVGCEVEVASGGSEAMELLQKKNFDALLLDIQMPVVSGIEVAVNLRAGKLGKMNIETPIIAMTACALPRDKQRCFEAGMSDYLSKPMETSELYEALMRSGLVNIASS